MQPLRERSFLTPQLLDTQSPLEQLLQFWENIYIKLRLIRHPSVLGITTKSFNGNTRANTLKMKSLKSCFLQSRGMLWCTGCCRKNLPTTGLRKGHFRSLCFIKGRQPGRSPFCTSRQARQQTHSVSWILLQLGGKLGYLQLGPGHLRWAPLCHSIQDPVAESVLIFQYTTVWARMEHMNTDSVISFSIHSP